MTHYLAIGTTADYYAAPQTWYDLSGATAGNIYALGNPGSMPTTLDDKGNFIMVFQCIGENSNLISEEETIEDYITQAVNYHQDKHNNTPVYIWEYGSGETAKRAVIVDGEIARISRNYIGADHELGVAYYVLTLNRKQWEYTSAITILNASGLNGTTNTLNMTSVKGDIYNRISELTFTASADNDETTPLTEGWWGIRPKYQAMASFNPIWELENASYLYSTGVNVTSVADSNTYPHGSSTNNAVHDNFTTTAMTKRLTISLLDAITSISTNLVTNGGAELNSTAGWTESLAGISVTSTGSLVNSGTYAFYAKKEELDVLPVRAQYYQDITPVTVGDAYLMKTSIKIVDQVGPSTYVRVLWTAYTSGNDLISTIGWVNINAIQDYTTYTMVGVIPATTSYVRIMMEGYFNGVGSVLEFAIDDIKFFNINHANWLGEYLVLMRSKLDTASKSVDAYLTFGYIGSTARKRIGPIQKIEHTDWKWTPMGIISIPPGRQLTDEEAIWRIGNLGFDLYLKEVTGSTDIFLDSLALVPSKHGGYVNGCSICQSASAIDSTGDVFNHADFHVYTTEVGDVEPVAESSDFTGINNSIRAGFTNWKMPASDCLFVSFFQRDASHKIDDDYTATLKYVPVFRGRNTD